MGAKLKALQGLFLEGNLDERPQPLFQYYKQVGG
jgi:hypothetical protein